MTSRFQLQPPTSKGLHSNPLKGKGPAKKAPAGRRRPAPPRKKRIVRKAKEVRDFNEPQDLETWESWLGRDQPNTNTGSDPWKLNDAPGFSNIVDETKLQLLATWEQLLL